MSATDELRRMLDERGVEYESISDTCTYVGETQLTEYEPGIVGLQMRNLTPDQAIAATLGGRECVITPIAPGSDMGRCSTCEQVADVHSNYCWKCGAKVVKR